MRRLFSSSSKEGEQSSLKASGRVLACRQSRSCDDWSATSALLSEARDCIIDCACPTPTLPFGVKQQQQQKAAAMSGPSDPSLDIAEDEGEEEEEEIELTNEEKIAQLKDQLANGEMGPAVFDRSTRCG